VPGEANPGEADPVVESVEGANEPQEGNTEPTGRVLRDSPIGRGPPGTDQRADPSGSASRNEPTWNRSEPRSFGTGSLSGPCGINADAEPFGAERRNGSRGIGPAARVFGPGPRDGLRGRARERSLGSGPEPEPWDFERRDRNGTVAEALGGRPSLREQRGPSGPGMPVDGRPRGRANDVEGAANQ
jgi:hypothetical protein